MKYLEMLRKKRDEALKRRAELVEKMRAATDAAATEDRDLTPAETASFDESRSAIAQIDTDLGPEDGSQPESLRGRIAELEAIEERTKAVAPAIVPRREDPTDVLNDRSSTPAQLADAVTRSIEPVVMFSTADPNSGAGCAWRWP